MTSTGESFLARRLLGQRGDIEVENFIVCHDDAPFRSSLFGIEVRGFGIEIRVAEGRTDAGKR